MSAYSRLTPEARGLGMTSQRARDRLIERLQADGIRDRRVLDVMRELPRHLFVEEALATRAYEDSALPIGQGQTISQPWVVARMSEALLEFSQPQRVLEIGTGSGYQAAVLAGLVGQVYTVERIEELLRNARRRFRKLGIANLRSRHDDGRLGWPEEAPFDAIILTAAPPTIPQPLLDQLKVGGRMVVPVGSFVQDLLLITKTPRGLEKRTVAPVRFVPMTGEVQKKPPG